MGEAEKMRARKEWEDLKNPKGPAVKWMLCGQESTKGWGRRRFVTGQAIIASFDE